MGRFAWDFWIIAWLGTSCNTILTDLNPPTFHLKHHRGGGGYPKAEIEYNRELGWQGGWVRLTWRQTRWILQDDRLIRGEYSWAGCLCQPMDYDANVFRERQQGLQS
jgi:hypothetical protein